MKIRICLLVAVWKRPEVTVACFHNIKRLVDYRPELFEITPVVVVSEKWAARLCQEFGFAYILHKNKPLGKKMNVGLKAALMYDWNWLMQLGSDDFVEPVFLDFYFPYLVHGKFFGQKSLVVVDAASGEMKQITTQNVFGALRCIRRELIVQSLPLWEPERMRGLDGSSMKSIQSATGISPEAVTVPVWLFDYKTGVNINTYDRTAGHLVKDLSLPVELKVLLKNV